MLSRRHLLTLLPVAASGQSQFPTVPNIGFKADTEGPRSECGVGALMPWADSLWAVTYNSHKQSTGRGLGLYRIGDDLKTVERVHVHNGTHANRLVHRESNTAFIGPYAIDAKGNWRFLEAFADHRLTATMRHLTDPAGRLYFLTMEGLLFEMDVASLKATLITDLVKQMNLTQRPHFKGGFTEQGRVVVANNGFYQFGENGAGLFEWDGQSWKTLSGKPHMDCAGRGNMGEVIFCTGWDESSALLWALVKGQWKRYRLPKASHSYNHAWQTEWMRIREVETEHFLLDLHGMFYDLQPVAFEDAIWGVKPICHHLRTVPDYCSFRGLLALGGNEGSPNSDSNSVGGQPQSGLWFAKTDDLWSWGKPTGWGGPWRKQWVLAGNASDPFLMTGFDKKVLHLRSDRHVTMTIQVDFLGDGSWETFDRPGFEGYKYIVFPEGFSAHWVRIVPEVSATYSAEFVYT